MRPPLFRADDTRDEALRRLRLAFAAAGVPEASLDARLLLAAAAGTDGAGLATHPERRLGEAAASLLCEFARRRIGREPVGRLLGTREFWGLPFRLSAGTLEPRPDTETVVEAALAAAPNRDAPLRILDLGTGSGCLLIAILTERPGAWGVGIDRSPDALRTARANAGLNRVGGRASFLGSDWGASLEASFDLVVSNPPYIPSAAIGELAPEVARHDPVAALDGGRDGLAAYRLITADLPRLLAPGGSAILEIGHDQAASVRALAAARGLAVRAVVPDLAGRDRALVMGHAVRGLVAPKYVPIS